MSKHLRLYAACCALCAASLAGTACALARAPSYRVVFPALPEAWREVLGEPHWRVVWSSPHGEKTLERYGNGSTLVDPLQEWTNPVIAYPFWPERGVPAGLMKPAGGLFPFDVDGETLNLSWQGGVDAFIYVQLASMPLKETTGTPRYSHYFNWLRFRELLDDDAINETVRADLWSVDWELFCQKTALSGFDKRRIVPRKTTTLLVPVSYEGVWISDSPFAPAFFQKAGTKLTIKTSDAPSAYISSTGILRCTGKVWTWERTSN